jgi:ParB family chromosome partitioning protein
MSIVKKRGLNLDRGGLGALLNESIKLDAYDSVGNTQAQLIELDINTLIPGRFQPRKTINDDELAKLADSIKSQGILQPIIVKNGANNTYEIIAGERRWRAAKLAQLKTVPVVIKDVDDQSAFAIAIIENIQREQLNALEEALAYERLIAEFGLSHEKIAEFVGKSRSSISNSLRLLSLKTEVKLLLERNQIDVGHAKVLLPLSAATQQLVVKEVVAKQLSVRATEALIAKLQAKPAASKKAAVDPDVRSLENNLSAKLGAAVKIFHSSKGRGRILIKYNSLDELDGIIAHIGLNN